MLLALEGKIRLVLLTRLVKEELFLGQIFSKRAKHVWEELKETYDKVDGSIMFSLNHQIHTPKQNGSSIVDYYHKLNAFEDDSYMQIRSSILSREVLPDVRIAYATISSVECHRVVAGSIGGKSDYSLYTKSDKGVFLTLLVYVDDIIITGNIVYEIKEFKVFLKSKFIIKDLGKLKYFLGIKVIDTEKGICLNQRKYVLDLLFEYDMLACKPAKTPLIFKFGISNEACKTDHLLDNIIDY
uniref:Ribonuclease H-like domain-containing protein n=1 Tax=Tanacetum cinerariifolium TaxID=118510 RepID=A0A6L2MQF4_TANCI|nr:ribonuclease H-like domain-containing protein [Tanacetum cinerariifolium]